MEEKNKEIKQDVDESINETKKKDKKVSTNKFNAILNENEKLKKDIEYWKNKYYQTYADIDNLRKSIEKDHRDVIKYRASGFLEKLLPSLDSFNLAISTKSDDEKLENFLQGFRYIYKNIINSLEEEGLTEIKPEIKQKFDEKTMHAIDTIECDDEENLVAKVYANGYKLHDRIIRPAMVYVTKHKVINTKEKEEEK